MGKKVLICVVVLLTILFLNSFAYSNTVQGVMDKIPTNELEEYVNNNNSYFDENNINIRELINDAFNGKLNISLKDYLSYQFKNEKAFFRATLKTGINIVAISMLLTIINYFSDEIKNQGVSDIVVIFSVIIIFTIILKDVLAIKELLQDDFSKIKVITEEINAIFMTAMLTFGKLSILQFFQTSLNYVVGITTQLVYGVAELMTILMIVVILINNIGGMINVKLLYKFLKKGTLLILSGYMIIVVINFSVQGYILYKTDNIFVSSLKALSPSVVPVVGKAVGNFFGMFIKSILMIKDVLGIVVIVFMLSAFGGSILKIIFCLVLYKAVGVITEPFNDKLSKMIYEMADIFYIYLICMAIPIIIITVYYSILLNYINNIFG